MPEYHVGRHKGVKNKRTGSEKAVDHQARSLNLRGLLKKTQEVNDIPDTEVDTSASDLVKAYRIRVPIHHQVISRGLMA